jgi:CheY-like chemotaxis protein
MVRRRESTCPACGRECGAQALFCAYCGLTLGRARNGPDPLDAIEGDALTLREIDPAATADGAQAQAPPAQADEPIGVADPLAPRLDASAWPPWGADEPPTHPGPPQAPLPPGEAKRRRRQAVRRARMTGVQQRAGGGQGPITPEVLVVDADEHEREALAVLLRGFGFSVRSVATARHGMDLFYVMDPVAVFADVALDGADEGAGIALCRQVKDRAAEGGQPPLLICTLREPSASDRVRARLAGCDDLIAKPVARGPVAAVLDGHAVVMPSDARKA